MKIFAVYDEKAKIFGTPQFMLTEAVAVRTITDLVQDQQSMLAKHPKDYSLYQVGTYDEISGMITPEERPSLVIRCNSLVADKEG